MATAGQLPSGDERGVQISKEEEECGEEGDHDAETIMEGLGSVK